MKKVYYNPFHQGQQEQKNKRNTPMATILPIQGRFDKEIPEDFGNAEYRQECGTSDSDK